MITAKFKDSPLGPIPQDWEVKRLGDVWVRFSTGPFGSALHASDYVEDGTPVVNPMHILDGKIVPSKEMRVNDETLNRLSSYRLRKNDVILGRRGEMGRAALVTAKEDGWLCGTGSFSITLDSSVSPDYIALYIRTPNCIAAMENDAIGTTIPNLNQVIVSNIPIALPPLPEQQRIAEALGEVDKLIESLDEQIEKKRLIAKGVAHDLLGMRNDKNEPIRRLPGFKGAWEKKDYKDVFLHHKGKSIGTSEYESSGQFPVIDQGQEAVVAYSNNTDALFHVPDGGAIVFGDHTRIVKYVSKDFIVGADGTQILSGLGCDTQFLYHALRQIEIPNLGYNRHFKFIKNHQYSLPPTLAEQQAIVDMLSEQDAAIAALEAKREKYVRIKEGMMRDLLTGKVRMKGE